MLRAVVCSALICSLPALSASAAEPAAGDAVVIEAAQCPQLATQAVVELVALELSPRPVSLQQAASTAPASATRARLQCQPTGIEMSVSEPSRGKPLRLRLQLDDTPAAARTRLVALTLSELIVSSRMQRRAQASRARASSESTAAAPAPQAARQSWLWLSAGMARQGQPAAVGGALQAGVLADVGALSVLAGVQGDWVSDRFAAGEARMWTLSAAAAPALVLPLPGLALFGAAGMRLGYARLDGSAPTEPDVRGTGLGDLWLSPIVAAGLQLPMLERWALQGALELSYVVKPVRGLDTMDQALFALEGLRLTLAVGVALGL